MHRLALIGYGKMGRLIEQLAPQNGFEVAFRLSSTGNLDGCGITSDAFAGIDVAIEFSTPEATVPNLHRLAAIGVPTVTGTTGWLSHLPEIAEAFNNSG